MNELLDNDLVHLIVLIIVMIIMILSSKLKDCTFLNKVIPFYKYDFLTQLELRQDFDKKVTTLIEQNKPFFFSLIDINDLHSINKTQGYRQGDQVIKETADEIRFLLKKVANLNIYRIGGDEFIVISKSNIDVLLDNLKTASYCTAYFNNDKNYNQLFDEVDQGLMLIKKAKIKRGEFKERRQH